MKREIIILSIFLFLSPVISFAHSGRTDSSGCHTCRTNCAKWGLSTGEYHCHNSKGVPQPIEPIKSHFDESGGYTTPAPEYKIPKAEVKTTQPVQVNTLKENKPETNKKIEKPKKILDIQKQEVKQVETKSWFKKLLGFIFG